MHVEKLKEYLVAQIFADFRREGSPFYQPCLAATTRGKDMAAKKRGADTEPQPQKRKKTAQPKKKPGTEPSSGTPSGGIYADLLKKMEVLDAIEEGDKEATEVEDGAEGETDLV